MVRRDPSEEKPFVTSRGDVIFRGAGGTRIVKGGGKEFLGRGGRAGATTQVEFEERTTSLLEQQQSRQSLIQEQLGGGGAIRDQLLTVEPAEKAGKIETFIREKETKGLRMDLSISERAFLFGAGFVSRGIDIGKGFFGLGKAGVSDVVSISKGQVPTKTFGIVKNLPSAFATDVKSLGSQLRSPTPETALGSIGADIATFKLSSIGLLKGGKLLDTASARFSTKFTPVGKVQGGIGTGFKGVKLKTDVPTEFSVKGFATDFTFNTKLPVKSSFDIPFAPSPISKVAESVPEQIGRAGKKVRGVSAQTSFPLGSELDRLLFFDPKSRLRISRFGEGAQKQASFLDIVSGDFTFKRGRSQALFGEFDIATPPPKITSKLKKGQALTQEELISFQQFVETPAGKLKPVPQFRERGFSATEPELAFGKGEIPFKIAERGRGLVQGQRVDIIEIGVRGSSKETQIALENIKKSLDGKGIGSFGKGGGDLGFESVGGLGKGSGVSAKELQTSIKQLSKETGFTSSELSSQFFAQKPFVSIPRTVASSLVGVSSLVGRGATSASFPKDIFSVGDFKSPTGRGSFSFPSPPTDISSPTTFQPTPKGSLVPVVPDIDLSFDLAPTQKTKKIRRSDEAKRKKRRRKQIGREQIIRPSFTGIITGQGIRPQGQGRKFETPAFVTKIGRRDIGISPFALRGTRTGLAPPRKVKKKKKTSTKRKTRRKILDLSLANF